MPKQKFFTNEQVFGKPKTVFKPTGQTPLYKPEPMSLSTRNTGLSPSQNRNQNYFRPIGLKDFISQELFNLDLQNTSSVDIDFENPLAMQYYIPDDPYNSDYCLNNNATVSYGTDEQCNIYEQGQPPNAEYHFTHNAEDANFQEFSLEAHPS